MGCLVCFPGGASDKERANAGYVGDAGLIPGSGKSPGEGHGNPSQYSCLENPMDREAWWATILGVAQGQTRLKQLSTHLVCKPNLLQAKRIIWLPHFPPVPAGPPDLCHSRW